MKLTHALVLATAALIALAPASLATDTTTQDPSLTQVVDSNEIVAPEGTPVEISAGHVDLGPKFLDGAWTFLARDDSDQTPTWCHLDDVVLRVSDAAKLELPADDDQYSFISANGPVWAVPQSEIANVVWLGWNTQDPEVVGRLAQGATLVFEGHEGEGDFHTFVQAGNFSGPQQLWNSTKPNSQPIHVDANTHTHANWVFTQPGIHLIRLSLQAQLTDGTTVEDTRVLRFAVGDAADAQKALEAQWTVSNAPESPTPVDSPSVVDRSTVLPLWIAAGLGATTLVLVALALVTRRRSHERERVAERIVEGGTSGSVEAKPEASDDADDRGSKR